MDSQPTSKVLKTGFLKKRSKYLHLWKTRFCILTNKHLFAFTGIEKDADCTMTLLLENCIETKKAENELRKEFTFSVNTNNLIYYFQAENEKEQNDWVTLIDNQLNHQIIEKF